MVVSYLNISVISCPNTSQSPSWHSTIHVCTWQCAFVCTYPPSPPSLSLPPFLPYPPHPRGVGSKNLLNTLTTILCVFLLSFSCVCWYEVHIFFLNSVLDLACVDSLSLLRLGVRMLIFDTLIICELSYCCGSYVHLMTEYWLRNQYLTWIRD